MDGRPMTNDPAAASVRLLSLVPLIALVVAVAAPDACSAQTDRDAKVYRMGLLSLGRTAQTAHRSALLAQLQELGYSESTNLRIEDRGAGGDPGRLPALASELVASKVDVIIAAGNPAVEAVSRATQTIPIVMLSADPVASGFARSLSHPGGNITGLSTDAGLAIWGKRLELLKEAAPLVKRVAVLSRTGGRKGAWVPEVDRTARRLGVVLIHAGVRRSEDLPAALAILSTQRPDALFVSDTPLMFEHRRTIIEFAARHGLPDIHGYREAPEDGALMSYGIDIVAAYRQLAFYVDRLFKGAKPADLPIEQPRQFELIVNGKTARALGLTVSPTLRLRVDQVLE
jgi:putative ABC transport system substrate-binding protein